MGARQLLMYGPKKLESIAFTSVTQMVVEDSSASRGCISRGCPADASPPFLPSVCSPRPLSLAFRRPAPPPPPGTANPPGFPALEHPPPLALPTRTSALAPLPSHY